MDINYLLFLQNFRNGIHDAWTPFLQTVSLFSVTYLILLPIFIYWCISKRNGLYTLCATYLCLTVTSLLKLTVCTYRPWIRDPRIIPAGNAIETAVSYSFPSGHVAYATPVLGGLAVSFWRNKITRWLSVLFVMAILLTAFSRNYLGVHTPQDVIVAIFLGVGSLAVSGWILRHPNHENIFLLGGVIGCVLALLYILFKSYPMDYVNDKLLVDPVRMMNDGFSAIGALSAFCMARYVEKRWIRFRETGITVKGILLGIVGIIGLKILMRYIFAPAVAWVGPHWGRLIFYYILVFYMIALYPLVLKWAGYRQ